MINLTFNFEKGKNTNLEPIDSTTVDQGRELPQSVPEGVSDGTKGNNDVEVLTATVHKESKQGQGTEVSHLVSCLGQWSHSLLYGEMKSILKSIYVQQHFYS